MKILVLSNIGMGLYKFRKELIERLIAEDHDVSVSFPEDEYTDDFKKLGCEFIGCDLDRRGMNPIKELKLINWYYRLVKNNNYDLVLTYTIKPNVYGGIVCRLLKIPYIVNITGLGTSIENGGILSKISLSLYKMGSKKANCVCFQNEQNEQLFLDKNIVKKNYRIIPGSGVNLKQFSVLEYPSEKTIEFVFISRIMKEKGVDQYLKAAEYIRNKYSNTRFHVCGFCEGDYENKLKEFQEKGIITYHGMVRDIREILIKVHCTIHPTYYPEGMSNVLLESAASGRPIITTDRSGCREIVDDGVNGFVVKQQNSNDLIEKIEEFLKLSYETKKQMGLSGRTKVEREFDRQIVVDAYVDEIDKIMSKKK